MSQQGYSQDGTQQYTQQPAGAQLTQNMSQVRPLAAGTETGLRGTGSPCGDRTCHRCARWRLGTETGD